MLLRSKLDYHVIIDDIFLYLDGIVIWSSFRINTLECIELDL